MGRSTRPADDGTGDAATGNVAGGVVLNAVLATQDDQLDQVLILTHLALGIPLTSLVRDLKTDRRELETRMARILNALSRDTKLSTQLSGIRRAGQIEHYYPIIARLGLRNWFCARPGCPNLIVQSQTGRPRRTCSRKCRNQLHRGNGIDSQDHHDDEELLHVHAKGAETDAAEDAVVMHQLMLYLMQPFNFPTPGSRWSHPNIHCRDRALLLLGLTCPAPLIMEDLCHLDVDDVGATREGFEVKVYKRREGQPARYITILAGDDTRLCTAQALLSWRRILTRNGRTTGPLFIQLERDGSLPRSSIPLRPDVGTRLVHKVLWDAAAIDNKRLGFRSSMPVSDFPKKIMTDIGFRETILNFKPKQGPLGHDPCE